MKQLLVSPRLTEKTYLLAAQGIYTFDVPVEVNRQQIAAAIEEAFKVDVKSIRIIKQTGKAKRYSRGKRAFPGVRREQDSKKALVRLGKGQTIAVFEQGTDSDQTDKKEKK